MTIRPSHRVLAALAAAVALTACGDDPEEGAPGVAADTVAVVGQDNLTWDSEELTVDAGTITVQLTCEDAVNHNFVIEIEETDELVAECAPGESTTETVDLEAGVYDYICTVPGHEATMQGTLTVD